MRINLTFILLLIILVLSSIIWIGGCNFKKKNKMLHEQTNLINALGDTLRTQRLEDSTQIATIDALMTEKVEDILVMRSKDSAINALQATINSYKKKIKDGGSVVVVKGETNIKDKGVTEVDTPKGKNLYIPVWPIYKSTLTNKWYTANMEMGKDSSYLNLKLINSYDVVVGKEKNGIWFADVINYNPYSSTTAMRVYKVTVPKERPKRFGFGFQGGYGTLLKGPLQFQPYIGAGLSYNIITF